VFFRRRLGVIEGTLVESSKIARCGFLPHITRIDECDVLRSRCEQCTTIRIDKFLHWKERGKKRECEFVYLV